MNGGLTRFFANLKSDIKFNRRLTAVCRLDDQSLKPVGSPEFITGIIMFGQTEILIVLAVFLLLFGSAKLPSLMRNMGRSINEFKAGMEDKPVSGKIDKSEAAIDNESEAAS